MANCVSPWAEGCKVQLGEIFLPSLGSILMIKRGMSAASEKYDQLYHIA